MYRRLSPKSQIDVILSKGGAFEGTVSVLNEQDRVGPAHG